MLERLLEQWEVEDERVPNPGTICTWYIHFRIQGPPRVHDRVGLGTFLVFVVLGVGCRG